MFLVVVAPVVEDEGAGARERGEGVGEPAGDADLVLGPPLGDVELAAHDVVPDGHDHPLEVEVRPLQAENLAAAQAAVEAQHDERDVHGPERLRGGEQQRLLPLVVGDGQLVVAARDVEVHRRPLDQLLHDRAVEDAPQRLQHLAHRVVRLGRQRRLDRRDVRGLDLVEAAPREHRQEVVPQMDVVVHPRVDPQAVGLAQIEEAHRELLEGGRRRLLGLGLGREELREQFLLERPGPPFSVGLAADRRLDAPAQGPALGAVDDDIDFKLMLRSLPRAQLDHD